MVADPRTPWLLWQVWVWRCDRTSVDSGSEGVLYNSESTIFVLPLFILYFILFTFAFRDGIPASAVSAHAERV